MVLLNFVNRDNSIGVAAIFAANFVMYPEIYRGIAAICAQTDQFFVGFRRVESGHASYIHLCVAIAFIAGV